MLKNSFYTIKEFNAEGEILSAILELNPEHQIFKGHFPELPIVPGVCMVQIQKEIVEQYLDKKLELKKASNIKFLSFINPLENKIIHLEIKVRKSDTSTILVSSKLYFESTVFFKIDAEYI